MLLTIFVTNFIIDVWLGPKYVSVIAYLAIQFYFLLFIYFYLRIIHLVRTQYFPKKQYFLPLDTHTMCSYPLIHTCACAYQEIRKVSFSEKFAYLLNEWFLIKCWKCTSNLELPENILKIIFLRKFPDNSRESNWDNLTKHSAIGCFPEHFQNFEKVSFDRTSMTKCFEKLPSTKNPTQDLEDQH